MGFFILLMLNFTAFILNCIYFLTTKDIMNGIFMLLSFNSTAFLLVFKNIRDLK